MLDDLAGGEVLGGGVSFSAGLLGGPGSFNEADLLFEVDLFGKVVESFGHGLLTAFGFDDSSASSVDLGGVGV